MAAVVRSATNEPEPGSLPRFIYERGGGSHGTAYNTRDYEVIDLGRPVGSRVVARANRHDAQMIAAALNQAISP